MEALIKLPTQYYAKNYLEFFKQLNDFSAGNKFIVLTDGVFKKSSLETNTDIIDVFKELHKEFEHINLSKICDVKPQEIHASEFYLKKLMDILSEKQESCIFIALGSGTITDLLKHALFLLDKKEDVFISIPTATTVTAFTSHFSVIDIDGAKRTRVSRNIDATFWIEPLLKAAPMPLLKAGFGDLLARFVAYGDWYLGSQLGMFDNYDETALQMMSPYTDFLKCQYSKNSEDSFQNKSSSTECGESYLLNNMEIFTQTLATAGISMSISGQTTPLSGYEHVISHGLDFLRLSSNRELVLHGEQVALSVLSSAQSYEWLLMQDKFDERKFRSLNEKEARSLILKLLNIIDNKEAVCEIFLKDYLVKNERWEKVKNNFNNFVENWPQIKERLRMLVLTAEEIEKILFKMNLPSSPEETQPMTTAMEYRWAVRFAPFIRARFCLADFIFWIGEDPCATSAM